MLLRWDGGPYAELSVSTDGHDAVAEAIETHPLDLAHRVLMAAQSGPQSVGEHVVDANTAIPTGRSNKAPSRVCRQRRNRFPNIFQ